MLSLLVLSTRPVQLERSDGHIMTRGSVVCLMLVAVSAAHTALSSSSSSSSSSDSKKPDWSSALVHVPEFHYEDEKDEDKGEEEDIEGEEPEVTAIGIDLGFTQSCVGVYDNGTITIVPDEQGRELIPSYVVFLESGESVVGNQARKYEMDYPESTVYEVKRLIGRTWNDPAVQEYIHRFPHTKVVEKENQPHIEVNVGNEKKTFSPTEISAMIISRLKRMAEDFLGRNVSDAVIAVPAYFNDQQRWATKDAGTLAGLNVRRLMNEPSAAVVGYGWNKKDNGKVYNSLVYNLGSTTLDVTTVELDEGFFELVATSADHHLGGLDFHQPVADHLLSQFKELTGKVPSLDSPAVQDLNREVEKAIRALRTSHQVTIELESFYQDQGFSQTLTRTKLEELTLSQLRSSSAKLVRKVLKDSGLRKSDISDILLAGDSSHLPSMKQFLSEAFDGKEPVGTNADQIIAEGATLQAGVLGNEGDGEMLLCCPTVLSPVGIETAGGGMHVLIPYAWGPPTVSDFFTTATDNQSTVAISIYQGKRPLARDNLLLGQFNLTEIPPAPRGVPTIRLTVALDINGKLSATATELSSGVAASLQADNDMYPTFNYRYAEEEPKALDKADVRLKCRLRAMSSLQSYVCALNGELKGDWANLQELLSPDELAAVSQAMHTTMEWLDNNADAERDDLDLRRGKLAAIIQPIIRKHDSCLTQQAQPEPAGES